jgi:hypothetical protein
VVFFKSDMMEFYNIKCFADFVFRYAHKSIKTKVSVKFAHVSDLIFCSKGVPFEE